MIDADELRAAFARTGRARDHRPDSIDHDLHLVDLDPVAVRDLAAELLSGYADRFTDHDPDTYTAMIGIAMFIEGLILGRRVSRAKP